MHRHGFKGRKLSRKRDPRKALIKGLATAVVEYQVITTTMPKAKEVVPYLERLITKAKAGGLHNRRQIIRRLSTVESAHKLVDRLAPQMTSRVSGHLRLTKLKARRGDNAPMVKISFVDEFKSTTEVKDA